MLSYHLLPPTLPDCYGTTTVQAELMLRMRQGSSRAAVRGLCRFRRHRVREARVQVRLMEADFREKGLPINPNIDLGAGAYDRPHKQLHGVGPRLPLPPKLKRAAQRSRARREGGPGDVPSPQERQQRPSGETGRTATDADAAFDAPAPPDAPADAPPLVSHRPLDDAEFAFCCRATALNALEEEFEPGTVFLAAVFLGAGMCGGRNSGGGDAASVAPAACRLSSTRGHGAVLPAQLDTHWPGTQPSVCSSFRVIAQAPAEDPFEGAAGRQTGRRRLKPWDIAENGQQVRGFPPHPLRTAIHLFSWSQVTAVRSSCSKGG